MGCGENTFMREREREDDKNGTSPTPLRGIFNLIIELAGTKVNHKQELALGPYMLNPSICVIWEMTEIHYFGSFGCSDCSCVIWEMTEIQEQKLKFIGILEFIRKWEKYLNSITLLKFTNRVLVGLAQAFGVLPSDPEFKPYGTDVCEFHPFSFLK
ncbi:unnamed protein product [Prunus armeniaca]|uniref:Uncharacterized protein n=1 Tax=Prunus armeniaca TaxID=36596 RepID=A0A6J5XTM2_PRUAR|nr:unnamed protein product [Prunus armeniaca]CAB4317129.1 unnamed protein product [Prunus armeniaca]